MKDMFPGCVHQTRSESTHYQLRSLICKGDEDKSPSTRLLAGCNHNRNGHSRKAAHAANATARVTCAHKHPEGL